MFCCSPRQNTRGKTEQAKEARGSMTTRGDFRHPKGAEDWRETGRQEQPASAEKRAEKQEVAAKGAMGGGRLHVPKLKERENTTVAVGEIWKRTM